MKKELLEKLTELGYKPNFSKFVTELGVEPNTLKEALWFCEEKINEYWVDIPIGSRDEEAKEMAKKCSVFKKLRKEIKEELKAQ
jgi:hypothetical protein